MFDRRVEPRMLCADMVDVQWKDKTGRLRKGVANLEDISLSGACLQFDQPIPLQTDLRINHPKGELLGKVRYCVYREIGYFLGIEFEPGCRWSEQQFKPQHMLDPRRLVLRTVNRISKLAN
jgi:PilZ domain